MHSDWFNGIEILHGRWQHGEKVGYCYPSGLEKTLCKWDVYVTLVTKGLMPVKPFLMATSVYKTTQKFSQD
jgi:hypothetical protein